MNLMNYRMECPWMPHFVDMDDSFEPGSGCNSYPLTNSLPWIMALIEIDGLPINNGDFL